MGAESRQGAVKKLTRLVNGVFCQATRGLRTQREKLSPPLRPSAKVKAQRGSCNWQGEAKSQGR